MSDEADACECVWSHEFAMQRLLAFIRQNQNECTDTYCIDGINQLQRQQDAQSMLRMREDDSMTDFVMMIMLVLGILFMYLVRPQTILSFGKRKSPRDREGRGGGPSNSDQSPPPPPPAPPAVN